MMKNLLRSSPSTISLLPSETSSVLKRLAMRPMIASGSFENSGTLRSASGGNEAAAPETSTPIRSALGSSTLVRLTRYVPPSTCTHGSRLKQPPRGDRHHLGRRFRRVGQVFGDRRRHATLQQTVGHSLSYTSCVSTADRCQTELNSRTRPQSASVRDSRNRGSSRLRRSRGFPARRRSARRTRSRASAGKRRRPGCRAHQPGRQARLDLARNARLVQADDALIGLADPQQQDARRADTTGSTGSGSSFPACRRGPAARRAR